VLFRSALGIGPETIEEVAAEERRELERREQQYRRGLPEHSLTGRTVILADDGLATGSTMRAAVAAARQRQPARVVAAVPVAARVTCEELQREADEVVCAYAPEAFLAVGQWYRDFSQTTDDEVHRLLEEAARGQTKAA
jgi:putative phosphoribosyl transferase